MLAFWIYLVAVTLAAIGTVLVFRAEDKAKRASLQREIRRLTIQRDAARRIAAEQHAALEDCRAFDRLQEQLDLLL